VVKFKNIPSNLIIPNGRDKTGIFMATFIRSYRQAQWNHACNFS